MNIDPRTLDPNAVAKIAEYDAKAHDTSLVGFLLAIIPTTFVSALTSGSILQALFAAILFGIALSHTGAAGAQVLGMLEKLSSVFFYLVGMLMRFAPIGALRRHGLHHRRIWRRIARQSRRADRDLLPHVDPVRGRRPRRRWRGSAAFRSSG